MVKNDISEKQQAASPMERSEEVQAIIDRMPTTGATWVAVITGILIGVVFLLGFIIKYPDTMDGQITITARSAPVRLVANSTGKVHLLITDKSRVSEGDVIGYIESGVNYEDVLRIDSLLAVYNISFLGQLSVPPSLTLGEIASTFSAFMIAHLQYLRFVESDMYKIRRSGLQRQIRIDEEIIRNMEKEDVLKKQLLQISGDRTRKDSALAVQKAISEEEYLRQSSEYLSHKYNYEAFRNEMLSRQAQIYKNRQELEQLDLEEQENKDRLLAELLVRKNELTNAIRVWKEKYVQYAPVCGELEFLGFWRENGFVQNGQELFSIIPSKNKMVGEVMIPSYGVGKIKVGQTANVKIENYPYDEYGLMKGKVQSISRLSHKMQTADGKSANAYRVIISFPYGAHTNFGKELMLDFESVGNVEIITKPKRLIERLFDNLKAKTEK